MRLQPGVRVEDVRGDLVELAGQLDARLQVVRAPVRGECGVEAVGEQLRHVHALRPVHRLVRELHPPRGLARVCPAPGERGSDTGPVRVVGGADQHVVELGGQPARLGAEDVARRCAEHRARPPGQVAVGTAACDRLVIEAGRLLHPAGRARGVGPLQEIVEVGARLILGTDQLHRRGVLALPGLVPVAGAVDGHLDDPVVHDVGADHLAAVPALAVVVPPLLELDR